MVIDSCPVAGVFALAQPALGVMGVGSFCSPPGAGAAGRGGAERFYGDAQWPTGVDLSAVAAGVYGF